MEIISDRKIFENTPKVLMKSKSNNSCNKLSALVHKVSAFRSFNDVPDGLVGQSGVIVANLNFGANGKGHHHMS